MIVGVCRGKRPIFEESMAVLIEMPVAIYQMFLGRCPSLSREYDLLKNAVVSRTPVYVQLGNVVECLCELDDAELLLTRAKVSYPRASSYIEEGIRLAQKPLDASQIGYRKTAVQLRDHPQMNFAGYANWPPIWVSGAGSKTYKKNLGEIGTLIGVILNNAAPDKLFLRMELKTGRYMGCLAFNDQVFCRQLYIFLQGHIGKPIKEIGDLDLSLTL
jgi:hypothetical protein